MNIPLLKHSPVLIFALLSPWLLCMVGVYFEDGSILFGETLEQVYEEKEILDDIYEQLWAEYYAEQWYNDPATRQFFE